MAGDGRRPTFRLFREKRVNDPERALAAARREASGCTRCHLYKNATQTVFGEGPADASLMLVGEQPGDQEDLAGRPFVGPAGKVLDHALEAAGIDRAEVYVTNAVKHFKNEPRGKRRIHKKPDTSEIDACRWWLDHELDVVQPDRRGAGRDGGACADAQGAVHQRQPRAPDRAARGGKAIITVHPSYLLRLREERDKRREFDLLVKDLRLPPRRRDGPASP